MSDEVPLGVGETAQGVDFAGKFLDSIFAEDPESCRIGFSYAVCRKRLAHAHQRNFSWIATRPPRGGCDAFLEVGNVFCDRHGEYQELSLRERDPSLRSG